MDIIYFYAFGFSYEDHTSIQGIFVAHNIEEIEQKIDSSRGPDITIFGTSVQVVVNGKYDENESQRVQSDLCKRGY